MANQALIATGNLRPDSLLNKVAVVTGAGSGIGFEAARALAWLGAVAPIFFGILGLMYYNPED